MNEVRYIVKEEILAFLKENDDSFHDYYEAFDRIRDEVIYDFLHDNNEDMTKEIKWHLIPYSPLKRIWEDFVKTGEVQNVRGLERIERIAIRNTLLIDVITNFVGHDNTVGPDDLEEAIREFATEQVECHFRKPDDPDQLEMDFETGGHKRKTLQEPCTVLPFIAEYIQDNFNPDNMDIQDIEGMVYDLVLNKFYEYYTSGGYSTDYGLRPLRTLAIQLYGEQDPKQKLMLIDKILNVIHQTSDLAAWFIQGGSDSLNDLSGYHDEEGDSVISGKYDMSSYY